MGREYSSPYCSTLETEVLAPAGVTVECAQPELLFSRPVQGGLNPGAACLSHVLRNSAQKRTGRQKADFPAKRALPPRYSSMRMSWLYFSTRSPRQGAPVLR